MAKLPGYRRILKQDLSDAPNWVMFLIQPLNLFMERVTKGFEKGLTFKDNIDSESYSVRVPSATGVSIDIGTRRINGVLITRVSPEAAITPVWEVVNGKLKLGPWPSVPSADYQIDFIVI